MLLKDKVSLLLSCSLYSNTVLVLAVLFTSVLARTVENPGSSQERERWCGVTYKLFEKRISRRKLEMEKT